MATIEHLAPALLVFSLVCPACGDDSADDGGSAPATGGGGTDVTDVTPGTSEDADVVINEFMPSNTVGITDEAGARPDWIELFNRSDATVDLSNYYVSDKQDEPLRAQLPAGLSIEPGDTLLLWADNDPEEGETHLPFKLNREGEFVILATPEGAILDVVEFVDATSDSSFARVPDGTGEFFFCGMPTPDAPNDPSCGS